MSNYNDSQKAVIEAPIGIVLVRAAAGTGKTRVLTERIIYLLENCGISPESILAITFTNLAASEMKERITDRLMGLYKVPEFIGTIHSLFSEILRRDIEKVCSIRKYDFEIFQEDEQILAIQKAYRTLKGKGVHPNKARDIKNLISLWKVGKFLKQEYIDDKNLLYYEDIFLEYEAQLRYKNKLDFDDVLIFSLELLEKHKDIRDFWRQKYTAILVDELQDLNEIQWRLIKTLLPQKKPNFFAVGDPNQCIFLFNQAKENIFEEIALFFPDLNIYSLGENYRSSNTIVSFSNEIKQIKDIVSVSVRNVPGKIIKYETVEEVFEYLLSDKNYSNWAILFPRHSHSRLTVDMLIEHDIPFRISKFYLFEEIVIEQFINLLHLIFFDNCKPLRSLIRWREFKFTSYTRDELLNLDNLPENTTLLDFLLFTEEWKQYPIEDVEIKKLECLIVKLRELRSLPKENLVYLCLQIRKFLFPIDPAPAICKKMDLFLKWLSNIQKKISVDTANEIVLNIKSYAEFSKEEISKKEYNFVTLSTIHKTKGLEWENVIVLQNEFLEKSVEEQNSDKHLAYVAFTRAKNNLFLVKN